MKPHSWWLDVKLGVRMLVKYPGLALVGGIGIAVAVAIAAGGFSVVYGNFRPSSLPLEESDRIVAIEVWDAAASNTERRLLHDYLGWREELKSIQELGAFRTVTPNLIAPGAQPGSVRVASMSSSGFRVARVRPLMGRILAEDDDREGARAVVVIGETVWRNRFGADPAILGRTVQLGATSHAIVGVMPESFGFPVNHQAWTPLRAGSAPSEPLTGPDLTVFGRLAPGATLASAQAELAGIGRRAALSFPRTHAKLLPRVLPYPYPFLGLHETNDVAELHTMQGIVGLLLVLVCLNVAILVYTRTATRQSEITIRTALGASRGRIVGQLFIEAFVMSTVAAVAGIAIAAFSLRLLAGATLHIAAELPFWVSFRLVPAAVVYAGALSVLAAAIVGIVPALKATRRDAQEGLRIIGSGGSGARLGKTWTLLIVAQVAFAVALLPTAISNGWGSLKQGIAGLGFAAEEYLSAQLGMDLPDTPEVARRYADRQIELMRRLEAEPRVASVTFAMANPGEERAETIESQAGIGYAVRYNRVDAGFFRGFEVPILAGRAFQSADLGDGGAVVVNRSLAQRVFNGDALGRRIRYAGGKADPGRWHEIVGIVPDFPTGASPEMGGTPLRVYHAVAAGQVRPATLAIRVRGGVASTFGARLREIAAAVDPDIQLRTIVSLDEAMRREQWIRRLEASVLAAVTVAVLMLSSAGIYALMSITVSQRRKEIGIRMALGADPKRIVASIFSRALGQLAVGAALGMGGAVALQRATDLTDGSATVVLFGVALFVMAVGFLAALGPARRSLRIEPTEALRDS